mmetsp:Transcript_1257/g.1968  ORF Transcript_1257/g.1968 Transcript_1257/m.1968 type:complete len:223 (+) Transcript_1257:2163-2831(+)
MILSIFCASPGSRNFDRYCLIPSSNRTPLKSCKSVYAAITDTAKGSPSPKYSPIAVASSSVKDVRNLATFSGSSFINTLLINNWTPLVGFLLNRATASPTCLFRSCAFSKCSASRSSPLSKVFMCSFSELFMTSLPSTEPYRDSAPLSLGSPSLLSSGSLHSLIDFIAVAIVSRAASLTSTLPVDEAAATSFCFSLSVEPAVRTSLICDVSRTLHSCFMVFS